jgi:arginyl-tRNA synthetase
VNIFEHVRKIIIQVAKTRGIQDDKILDKITAEPPKDEKHGDISSNIALLASKILNMNPRELAEGIGLTLQKNDYIDEVNIAGPGFINLTLNKSIFYE